MALMAREEVWTPLSREDLRHKLKPERLGINGSQDIPRYTKIMTIMNDL